MRATKIVLLNIALAVTVTGIIEAQTAPKGDSINRHEPATLQEAASLFWDMRR